jgi:LVIVD repeat
MDPDARRSSAVGTRWAGLCQSAVETAPDGAAAQAVQLDLTGHLGGKNGAVFVQGQYACATFGRELDVLDVSDPAQAEEVGRCPAVGGWGRLHVADGYAYATGGESGDKLWVVDVSDPSSPTAVSTYTLPVFFAGEVHVADHLVTSARLAYINTLYNGLWVVGVSDPAHPAAAGSFAAWGFGRGVQAVGDAVYLVNGDEGLFVLTHSTLEVTPTAVTWLARVGGDAPRPRTLQVGSSGSSLAWTATISPAVSWLEATPLSGATPAEVMLSAHVAGLGVGRYETQLLVDAGEGVIGSPQAIPVTLIVAEQVFGSYLPLVLRNTVD